jgi:hypothetical protein
LSLPCTSHQRASGAAPRYVAQVSAPTYGKRGGLRSPISLALRYQRRTCEMVQGLAAPMGLPAPGHSGSRVPDIRRPGHGAQARHITL